MRKIRAKKRNFSIDPLRFIEVHNKYMIATTITVQVCLSHPHKCASARFRVIGNALYVHVYVSSMTSLFTFTRVQLHFKDVRLIVIPTFFKEPFTCTPLHLLLVGLALLN